MKKKAVVTFLWLFIFSIAAAVWGMNQIRSYVNTPLNISEERLITVEEGANYPSFTRQLIAEGLIEESFWSRLAGRIYPQLSKLKAGTYQISPNLTLLELFQLTLTGKEHLFSITLVEGTTFKQWREALQNTPNLKQTILDLSEAQIAQALNIKHEKLEGLFLPETYFYTSGESDLTLLRRAFNALNKELETAWNSRKKKLPLKSKYELLTLASIIEKETAVAEEREKVASVFINRLKINMRLQTDPTVIYGMGESYTGNIRKRDLQKHTPYNTYVIYGLPPSPIAMPSKASIIAAAQPEKTPYYYFVARGDGGHKFSRTLAEHNRAVRAYLNYLKKNK